MFVSGLFLGNISKDSKDKDCRDILSTPKHNLTLTHIPAYKLTHIHTHMNMKMYTYILNNSKGNKNNNVLSLGCTGKPVDTLDVGNDRPNFAKMSSNASRRFVNRSDQSYLIRRSCSWRGGWGGGR